MHERTSIRYYLTDLLKKAVDVKDRVFVNRVSEIYDEEMPLVLVNFMEEPCTVFHGDNRQPDKYERKLKVQISVITEQELRPDLPINENPHGEDAVDRLGSQIEDALFEDSFFAKRLEGYTGPSSEGLLISLQLDAVKPYAKDVESSRELIGQKLEFTLCYVRSVRKRKRLKEFLQYGAAITRTNVTGETVDPVLTAAEGDVRNED